MSKLIFLFAACFLGTTQATDPDARLDLSHNLHKDCSTCSKKDTSAPSCATLAANAVTFSSVIYDPPGIHYAVMASDYYMARMALALDSHGGSSGQLCPGDESQWNDMQFSTAWTGRDSGQAWDWGFNVSVTRRQCRFPDDTYPFLCQGLPGSPGTYGETLGWLSYTALATDTVNNYWTLFGNCWDPDRPGHTGTNYARSWVVWNKRKTLTKHEINKIIRTITRLGFSTFNIFDTTFVNPTYNPIPPYPESDQDSEI